MFRAGAKSGRETAAASPTAQLQVFPTQPRAGQEATLQLRPYRLVSGRAEPAVVAQSQRWRVTGARQGHSLIAFLRFSRDVNDPYLWRIGYNGPAWGTGPAYPGFFSARTDKPVLCYEDPIPRDSGFYGSGWFGNKVLWVFDRSNYRGPMLIRGRQLNGMNDVRFDEALVPAREIG